MSTKARLLFWCGEIRCQIFFGPAQSRHETNAAVLFHHASPTFLFHIPPAGKFLDRAGLGIPVGRIEKKLHLFFHYVDLDYPMPVQPSCSKYRQPENSWI